MALTSSTSTTGDMCHNSFDGGIECITTDADDDRHALVMHPRLVKLVCDSKARRRFSTRRVTSRREQNRIYCTNLL